MRHPVPFFFMVILFLPSLTSRGQESDEDPKNQPIIATSGDVEIQDIQIRRVRASRAAKEADLTNMDISLWLATKGEERPDRILLKVVELDPIEDNTGKLLSPKKRLDAIPFLHQEVRGDEYASVGGKSGPVIHMLLDAPSRQATTIKSIKGKAVVSQANLSRLEFKDLSSISGKPLNDPKLKDFKIVPTIKVEEGDTVVTLRVPTRHARLVGWGLVKARRLIPSASEGESPEGDETVLETTYRGDQTKETFLGIVIAEPSDPREMEFHFKNIELP